MNWALFGYNEECPYGVFLGEANTKEELEIIKEQNKDKFQKFSYSHVDGSLPDFVGAISQFR